MEFGRQHASGRRLDIPAGTMARLERGDESEATLARFTGKHQVHGFSNLADGWAPAEDGYHPRAAQATHLAAGVRDQVWQPDG